MADSGPKPGGARGPGTVQHSRPGLTNGGEGTREAEVVDGIEGEKVVEELLPLILTAQEGIALVQLPAGHRDTQPVGSHQTGRGHHLAPAPRNNPRTEDRNQG